MTMQLRYFLSCMILPLGAVALALPVPVVAASSGDFSGWWGGFTGLENGTVVSTQSSSATGGQVSTDGQSIVTGDSSASAKTTTVIRAGDNGGTVDVEVTTTHGGTTNTESVHKEITAGESVSVDIATSSGDTRGKAAASIRITTGGPGGSVPDTTSASSGSREMPSRTPGALMRDWLTRALERFSSWLSFF